MALQELTYEIGYNVDDSGLSKSLQIISQSDTELSNMIAKVNSLNGEFSKVNTSMGELNKTTIGISDSLSKLNANELNTSLKNSSSNLGEVETKTERLQRLTDMVNDSFEKQNSKIAEESEKAQDLNNRFEILHTPLSKMYEDQKKFDDQINQSIDSEDKLSSGASKTTENIKRGTSETNNMKNAMSALNKTSSTFKSILGAFGFMGVMNSLAQGIKYAGKSFMDFQQQMASVHATLGDVTNKDMVQLSNRAIELSNKWGIASKDVADGEENLASHGLNTKQVLAAIQPSMLLAVAGNIQMKDATLDVSSAIRNFNLDASKAPHVADVYAKAAADTAANMSTMATAMSYIAPVASQAGWSIENTATAIGELSNRGVLGSKAGTSLREMYSRLVKPTKDATAEMKELGFSAIDPTTHKMKDIGSIVGDLTKGLSKLNPAQKNYALSVIFGQQALTGVNALLNTGKKAIDEETKSLEKSNGAAKDMADTANNTLAGSLRKLKSNIQNAFITNTGDTGLGKSLKSLVDALNHNMPSIKNNIQWLLSTSVKVGSIIKKNWDGIVSAVLGLGTAFATIKGIATVKNFADSIKVLIKLSTPTVLLAASVGLAAAGFAELKAGNRGLAALLFGVAGALTAVNIGLGIAAVLGLSVTWPIYAIAAAIGVAVAAAVYMHGKWGKVWQAIKATTADVVNPMIDIINGITGAINSVLDAINKLAGTHLQIPTISKIQVNQGKSEKGKALSSNKVTSGVTAAQNLIKPQPNLLKLLPKNASGTNCFSGGLSLVGEKGPEIVNLPKGSQIIPNNKIGSQMNSYKDIGKTMGTNLSNGLLTSRTLVDNSTNKVITDNKNLFSDYSKSHITYGQSSMQNLGNAITQKSPLVTTATTKVSTDNKNVMNDLSKSGLTYGTGMVNQLASGVNASSNNLTTTVKTLTDKVINQFKTGFGIHSPSVVMYKMGNYLMQGLVNGMSAKDVEGFIQHWIGDITSSAGGAMSGNVTGWLSAALAVTGTPMDWMSGLLRLVQAESGGNPLSVNPQGVGNEHATGLLQTLPSTFASYAVKGLNNILNPVANAAAAINYIKSQYGSVYNTPLFKGGTYVGYAQGTNNATPGLHWVGEKGPELLNFKGGESVTPNNKISSGAQKVYSGNRNLHVVFSPTVQVTIQGAGKSSGDTADEVIKKVKEVFDTQFEKKFGTLAIQLGLDEV